jgi:mono/diheme cytochrome c family protein
MRIPVRGLVLALCVALAACRGEEVEEAGEVEQAGQAGDTIAPSGEADTTPGGTTAVSGQAIYAANCATCHGETGRGDGPAAVGLEPPPADMTDGTWVTGDGTLPAIVNVIENGSPGTAMIGWRGTLSDAEIDAVARYVQSLAQ